MKVLAIIIPLLGTAVAHDHDHHLRHLKPNENANEMAHIKFEDRSLPPADVAYKRKNGNIEPGIRCVPDISGPKKNRELSEETRGNYTSRLLKDGDIKVVFHIIYEERRGVQEGNIPLEWIERQMVVLNKAYEGSGFSFSRADIPGTVEGENGILRHASNKYYTGCYNQDSRMKADYAVDPANNLNVYTCSPSGGTLGYAYYPDSWPENDYHHGCVVLDESLPGGSASPYNLGQTLTHEVGHYLGLRHTFSGGCDGDGDLVDDTPAEASAAYGCPTGRDTCPSEGEDPIYNFMDYTDDDCMDHFTQGQVTRMIQETSDHRPSITSSSTGSTVSSSTTGATTPAATTGATTSVATTGATTSTCYSFGDSCTTASDCCSNKCKGPRGDKTCK